MTFVLGLSAWYHDSAAALLRDGEIVAAAQEERFSRVKHDARFPAAAVDYCLREAGISPEQLDHVCFYDKPLAKFDRILETSLSFAPRGFAAFRRAMPLWLSEKLHLPREIRRRLPGWRGRVVFTSHHESHAASAFFPSPFETAAILTADGVGEWATTTWGVGEGNRIRLCEKIDFPHSLGLLYSALTYFTGFRVNSGEYKLMGLAPYGRPIYADRIREKLVRLFPDGSYRLNLDYFEYPWGLRMTGDAMARLFGGPARDPESEITGRERDIAASLQVVTEEILLGMARHVGERTGERNLCLAGGVALNCVANGRILREGPFENVWVQPAAGDAGGALGTALFAWHQLLGGGRAVDGTRDLQKGSFLGPRCSDDEIARAVAASGAVAVRHDREEELLEAVAADLAAGRVVGWFQGRMEFGPRALGGRSLLGDPRDPSMQATLNLKIKFRESFRPFAPAVLRERVDEFFETRPGEDSPYMLLTAAVRESHRLAPTPEQQRDLADPDLRRRVNVPKSTLPAITHVDASARIQTVDEERHGRFYRLLRAFERRTGCPVLVNTSFNVRGEPIVCRPEEALAGFFATGMDTLVLENHLLRKEDQPASLRVADPRGHLAKFGPD